MSQVPDLESVERREQVRVTEKAGIERREEVVKDVGAERRQTVAKLSNFIWLIAGVLEALIGLRVLLKLIAANPDNAFASFVYRVSEPLVAPFLSLTRNPTLGEMVLEVPSLIAMLAYGLVAWATVQLIWVVLGPARARRTSVYQRERD